MHYQDWLSAQPLYGAGYTREQVEAFSDGYDRYSAYDSQYGNLDDLHFSDILDYVENHDQAQQQLDKWIQEAGSEAAGFTDDQVREFKDYMQHYYQYGKPGELVPVDVGDFINNYGDYQKPVSYTHLTLPTTPYV